MDRAEYEYISFLSFQDCFKKIKCNTKEKVNSFNTFYNQSKNIVFGDNLDYTNQTNDNNDSDLISNEFNDFSSDLEEKIKKSSIKKNKQIHFIEEERNLDFVSKNKIALRKNKKHSLKFKFLNDFFPIYKKSFIFSVSMIFLAVFIFGIISIVNSKSLLTSNRKYAPSKQKVPSKIYKPTPYQIIQPGHHIDYVKSHISNQWSLISSRTWAHDKAKATDFPTPLNFIPSQDYDIANFSNFKYVGLIGKNLHFPSKHAPLYWNTAHFYIIEYGKKHTMEVSYTKSPLDSSIRQWRVGGTLHEGYSNLPSKTNYNLTKGVYGASVMIVESNVPFTIYETRVDLGNILYPDPDNYSHKLDVTSSGINCGLLYTNTLAPTYPKYKHVILPAEQKYSLYTSSFEKVSMTDPITGKNDIYGYNFNPTIQGGNPNTNNSMYKIFGILIRNIVIYKLEGG